MPTPKHLVLPQWQASSQAAPWQLRLGAADCNMVAATWQLDATQVATGSAKGDDEDWAQANMQASSPQPQSIAQSCTLEHSESARQELMASPHFSLEHSHASGHL